MQQQLSAMAPAKRAAACVALCNVFDSSSERKDTLLALATPALLRALNVRLMDSNDTVRLHAAGAVRNLAASKLVEVCERVQQAGLLTTMFNILQQRCAGGELAAEFVEFVEQLLGAVTSLWYLAGVALRCLRSAVFADAVTAAGCACGRSEAHESIVNALASSGLAPVFARLAATSAMSAGVCRRAAELLHVCSDNSPAICDQLSQSDGLIDLLASVCSGSASTPAASDAPCRVHLCGTLVHLAMYAPSIPAPAAIALVQQLLEVLTSFIIPQMEVNARQSAHTKYATLLNRHVTHCAAAHCPPLAGMARCVAGNAAAVAAEERAERRGSRRVLGNNRRRFE